MKNGGEVKKEKKINIKAVAITCLILAVIITAFAIIYNNFAEKPVEGEKNITVEVILSEGDKEVFEIKTTAEYLRAALEEKNLIEGTESEYGLFLNSVNGVNANPDNSEWWRLTKGGEELMTGVDMTPINDGDKFEITLTVGW